MPDLKFHDAANIFPLMEGDTFDELVESIREDGLQVPIELLDGKIIDGRNRYRACLLAGVEPYFVEPELGRMSPTRYVWLLNGTRRHMDKSQLSMVAGRMKDQYDREAKERMDATRKKGDSLARVKVPERESGRARDKAGEAVGVSGSSVDHATKVLDKGAPELIKAVDTGKMAVSRAAKLAELPKADQRSAIENSGQPAKGEPERTNPRGSKGLLLGIDAVNCLKRIPRNDKQRERAYEYVANFIRHATNNKKATK